MSLDVFRGATIASMMLVTMPAIGTTFMYRSNMRRGMVGLSRTRCFHFFFGSSALRSPSPSVDAFEAGERRIEAYSSKSLSRSIILFALGLFLNSFSYFLKELFPLKLKALVTG